MPVLLPGDVHFDQTLTNMALGYRQAQEQFVAARVFTDVNADKQSDRYWVWSRAEMNRSAMIKRAPSTESAGVIRTLSSDTYFADVWALHEDISDQTRANADSAINMDAQATEFLMFQGLLSREVHFAENFMVPGVWGITYTTDAVTPGSNQVLPWTDANSSPIEDIRAASTRMQLASGGFRPNKLVMGQAVEDTLINHPDFVDRVKYSGSNSAPAIVNRAALAALFGVEQVLVMGAVQNTATQGATESNAFIGGNSALLLYAPNSANMSLATAGVVFNWTGYLGNAPGGVRVSSFRMENVKSDRVEAEMAWDMKQTAPELGVFFSAIVP
jgi:hypothetical protein